jgi:hypothetical protein
VSNHEMPAVRMDGRNPPRSVPASPSQDRGSQVQSPGLPGPLPARPGGPPGQVPPLSRARGTCAPSADSDGIPPSGARRECPGSAALAVCLAPLASGEGFRLGFLGDPGSGKSYAARIVAQEYLRRSRGLVAVANSKGESGWTGEEYAEVAELRDRPNTGRALVFTPPATGDLDLEEIAVWQWSCATNHRCRSLVIWDEIADAAVDGEWLDCEGRDDVSRIGRCFTHGRRLGMSELWGAQYAHQVPREAYETTSCLCVWRQAGNALRILRTRGYADPAVEAVIAALPGDDVPPADRGEFVLLRRGRPWDGCTYRF